MLTTDNINSYFGAMGSGNKTSVNTQSYYDCTESRGVLNTFSFTHVNECQVERAKNNISCAAVGSDGVSGSESDGSGD